MSHVAWHKLLLGLLRALKALKTQNNIPVVWFHLLRFFWHATYTTDQEVP